MIMEVLRKKGGENDSEYLSVGFLSLFSKTLSLFEHRNLKKCKIKIY